LWFREEGVSADISKLIDGGWQRPLEVLAAESAQTRDSLREHLEFTFDASSIGDARKEAAEIIDTDRKGIAARLNGWRTFWPGRNVTWEEVVNKLINAFGEPADVDRSIAIRERHLQQLFDSRGLPRGDVVFTGEPEHNGSGLNLVRIARNNAQALASIYTPAAGPALNCVRAVLDMLHPINEEPFIFGSVAADSSARA
jgi:hypothetical protein